MPNTHPFPIATARSYASGAVHALSLADAYWLQDDDRVDETLAEALAGLDAARANLIAIQNRRRPRRHLAAAALIAAVATVPWLVAADLAHAADTVRTLEPFRWNGLSLFAVIAGAFAISFIPLRSRK